MSKTSVNHYDILIAGAGFAGSLMALILRQLNFSVCLVEKGKHPRFAIGESSTPIADMILRSISQQYNLPWLKDFSRYGSWQRAHPEIVCGIKRGFSYFKHHSGCEFTADADHTTELLVAASVDDVQSDTNWLRADFDAFLVDKVKEAGIGYLDMTDIVSAERGTIWKFHTIGPKNRDITSSFFIDATGSGNLLDTLLSVTSSSDGFLTDSFAVFSHFENVPRWTDYLQKAGIPITDFPYDPDNSALHQILDEGWLWMLRFNDDRISLGVALDGRKTCAENLTPEEIWCSVLEKYPTIKSLLKNARLSAVPGKLLKSQRLQRRTARCFGPGWVALPHTAGFIDPLFSPGIAHSLTGIQKVTAILQENWEHDEKLIQSMAEYEIAVFEELKFIDKLVAGCYQTMDKFTLFNAWSMLYFGSTIAYEQSMLKNKPSKYFLGADGQSMRDIVDESYQELAAILKKGRPSDEDTAQFTAKIKQRIAPFNIAGLLDPAMKNMYHHTAVSIEI